MNLSFFRQQKFYGKRPMTVLVIFLLLSGLSLWRFFAAIPPSPESRMAVAENIEDRKNAIVLTGSYDRLQESMKLLHGEQVDYLFISGVYPGLKLPELLHAMQESPICAEDNCIELGHRATNTRQNACESLAWLRRHNIRRFYLITSDYHWPRSYVEFSAVLRSGNYQADILPHLVKPFKGDENVFIRGKAWGGEYLKWLIANGRIFLENLLPKTAIMNCLG